MALFPLDHLISVHSNSKTHLQGPGGILQSPLSLLSLEHCSVLLYSGVLQLFNSMCLLKQGEFLQSKHQASLIFLSLGTETVLEAYWVPNICEMNK